MEQPKQLSEIIIERIARDGPISFRDYMDMCLYYPGKGYYKKNREKIGAQGDFFTSSSLTSSFGAMVGRQIEEMWGILGQPDFTIVEYGAGTGLLCCDVLTYLQDIPELYTNLHYAVIEARPLLPALEHSSHKRKVGRYDCISDIVGDVQCILSNELVDNFPVHQVIATDEQLMEIFVDHSDRGFTEVLRPAIPALSSYFEQLGIKLPKGFRTEVNLDSKDWIKTINKKLKKGFVITIDYGGLSEELYKAHRSCGTLVCYREHQINDDLYCNIGDQDITAHVNFSALIHWGTMNGIEACGITPQYLFLLSLGFQEHLTQFYESQKDRDIIQMVVEKAHVTRTLLFEMGEKYKVLIQSKNMGACQLKGLLLHLPQLTR